MRFVKMHGLGNDFVVVDGPVSLEPAAISELCDRHRGVGADGLLSVSVDGEVVMGYWNADGSQAEMCGNGLRCVALRASRLDPALGRAFCVHTPAGPRQVEIGNDGLVSVELGPVELEGVVEVAGLRANRVRVGNPHAVIEVPDPDRAPVAELGPRIERDAAFPEGTNVEFVAIGDGRPVRMRVWERGVGETLACGSGMVAAASVARKRLGIDLVEVDVPGGRGTVEFRDGTAWLTGPAVSVFEGEIEL